MLDSQCSAFPIFSSKQGVDSTNTTSRPRDRVQHTIRSPTGLSTKGAVTVEAVQGSPRVHATGTHRTLRVFQGQAGKPGCASPSGPEGVGQSNSQPWPWMYYKPTSPSQVLHNLSVADQQQAKRAQVCKETSCGHQRLSRRQTKPMSPCLLRLRPPLQSSVASASGNLRLAR